MKTPKNNKNKKPHNPAIDFQFFAINNPNKRFSFADKRAKILYNELSRGRSWESIKKRHNISRSGLYTIARKALMEILRSECKEASRSHLLVWDKPFKLPHKILKAARQLLYDKDIPK